MIKINIHDLNSIDDSKLVFAVIVSYFENKLVYVKHKNRETFEIPGGKREFNEKIIDTAKRELFEETGAIEFELTPLFIYEVEKYSYRDYKNYFGQVFFAKISKFTKLPSFEIKEIQFFDSEPKNLTYPLIQSYILKKSNNFLGYIRNIN